MVFSPTAPAAAGPENLGNGIWRIPVPLPMAYPKYLNCYLLELSDGAALIDTGWNTEAAWVALEGGVSAAGYVVDDIRAILITHSHSDHFGLAGRVRLTSGAWLGMHPAEAVAVQTRYGSRRESFYARHAELLATMGYSSADSARVLADLRNRHRASEAATPDRLLADRQRLDLNGRYIEARWTPGHSPGHLCFFDRAANALFAGDHVLARTTPSVGIHPLQQPNPLADFLASLYHMAREYAAARILPAHEEEILDLPTRVEKLVSHHETRLQEIQRVVRSRPGLTVLDAASAVSWSRGWTTLTDNQQRMASGEVFAHLCVLQQRGAVVQSGTRPVQWWTADDPSLTTADSETDVERRPLLTRSYRHSV
jgi:glyoxylase-like metal-dependent hydrolase (beta-lactamase superfamily II)